MIASTNSQQPGRNRWWSRDQRAERDRRIEQIQHINDPGTSRDEVLTWTRRILTLLLAFTGGIAVFSYYKFFGQNIPPIAAGTAAVLLAIVIEFGKNYLATKAVREPFFSGWSNIFGSVAETIYFLGVAGIASICFYVSVVNSTIGASQLSRLLSYQRNEVTFQPNTADIDAQIAATREAQKRNAGITWRGTVTYQAQKAIQSDGRAIEALQRQREKSISDQRADFERRQAQITSQTDHTAGLVLQVGGWVELLQALLIFLRVSCERILVDRQMDRERRQPSPTPEARQRFGNFSFNGSDHAYTTDNSGHPTFFNRGADGQVISTRTLGTETVHPVAQPVQPKTHTVTDERTRSAEKLLQFHRENLQKERGHFGRHDAPGVVSRVHRKLDDAYADIKLMGHGIQPAAVQHYCDYLEQVIQPLLDEKGGAYPRQAEMLDLLRSKAIRVTQMPEPIAAAVLRRYKPVEAVQA